MAEMQNKKDVPPSNPTTPEREMPLDTRLLSEAVIELNISRKNVGIYPASHIQITRSIDRAYDILRKLFEVRNEMTLGVAKDTLLVGQDYLDRKNPVYRDFALSLNLQGVAAVTFMQGLDKEELVRFHRVLTTKPEEIRAAGGVEKIMAGANTPHIKIQGIDYASFHLTEEKEIILPRAGGREKTGSTMWQDFVAQLVTENLDVSGQGKSMKDIPEIDPAELAQLLNERKLDAQAAVQSYENIITDYVRRAAEKKLTKEQSETFANLNNLLKYLHPELRRQFLSSAFKQVSSRAPSVGAEELVGGMPDDMVIEMLHQASKEGREISPTLTGLMQKLARVQASAPVEARRTKVPEQHGGQAPPISQERMEKLFNRETYETYVSQDYDLMLKQLTGSMAHVGPGKGVSLPLEEYEKMLEDGHLDFQIGRALLAFMEENIEADDYREFSRKLVSIVPDLLESGNFSLLLDIYETLRRQCREKPDPDICTLAGGSLRIFSNPDFTSKAVTAFDRWARTKGREAAGFLLAIGPGVVPELLDLYATDESPGGRKILFDLLCNFGQSAVNEAQKRLRDSRAYYVRNLVMLIRWAGSPAAVPYIKPLLQHRDQKVRMEVIAALLRFKDPGAVALLREALRSKDPDLASQAVFLAGQYRVGDVTNELVSMIKKVILFDADYTVNEEIVRALGEIGDARAIPDIEKLARASWTLYPDSLARMKVTLFESLGRYPRESINGLIKMGERSNDDRVRRACRKLAGKQ